MENTEQTQEQLSALLQVRRDKLTELQNDGLTHLKSQNLREHTHLLNLKKTIQRKTAN